MASLKSIRRLIRKLAYEVIVSKLSEGCVVYYPTKEINCYTIFAGGFILCDNHLRKRAIEMPEYGIRPAIMSHIIKNCINMRYDPRMIGFYVGEKKVPSLEQILDGDFEKEAELCDILFDGLKDGFSLCHLKWSKESNVEKAYEKILQLVEGLDE